MSLLAAARSVGLQPPRVCTRPAYATEASGDDAIELSHSIGLHLDVWQQLCLRVMLAETADSTWAAGEIGLLVSRQNGKSAVLEALALYELFVADHALLLWSAHQFRTTRESFLRIRNWIEGSEDLSHRTEAIATSTGNESVLVRGGNRLQFVARSGSGKVGRGFTPTKVIMDEAQECPHLAVEAVTYAMGAQANGQILFTGTVPSEANDGEYWTSLRDRGRAGGDPDTAWIEWSPTGSDDPTTAKLIDLDDPVAVQEANPAYPHRVTPHTVASERRRMRRRPDAHARERLSIWPSGAHSKAIIAAADWKALTGLRPERAITSFGVHFSDDGKSVGLAGALKPDDGPVFVETLEVRSMAGGIDRLAEWLIERWRDTAEISIGGKAGATTLFNLLRKAKVPERMIKVRTGEGVQTAESTLLNAIRGGTISHSDQPGLNASATEVGKAMVGRDGFYLTAVNEDADEVPVRAVALAYLAASTTKRRPGRVVRSVV